MTTSASIQFSLCWTALLAGSALGEDRLPEAVDRYVLFGFGPFAGRQENGSWQSLKQFAEGTRVRSVEIPVVWGTPRTKLMEATKGAGKVVLVGLGEGGSSYEVETIAFNERGNISDESGKYPSEQTIAREGETRLEAKGQAEQLVEKLGAKGFPAQI